MPWSDFEVFLALARGGSHAAAASTLQVDPTTVGRRIQALHEALGAQLFERTATGLRLSETGQRLLPRVERMEGEVLAAMRELRGADARLEGSVRITAPDGLVNYVLVPRLAELRRLHPGLEVEVRAEAKVSDLSRREADVALRLSRPKESGLVARRVGSMRFGLYAAQDYLALHGTPRSVAELSEHEFIAFDGGVELPQQRWLRDRVAQARNTLRFNTTASVVAACLAGHGIALLPTFAAVHEPRLVALVPRLAGPTRELWVVTHQAIRRNARVAAVSSWLARALAD
jgi:DNA-binding transcriptional LysR family regulator